ncbi:MAG: UvrB/UvrC motif-containing protein [Oscillibacter sp.]|nr:UvrB/UvrC motif-containing protein [Oscillibacter sp.]
MKCENCGKNEVTFVYRSNVNGKVEEKHLCHECAEKLGYTQRVFANRNSLFGDVFGDRGWFGTPLLGDFFPSMSNWMGRMLEDPFDDFFAEMPALTGAAPEKTEKAEEKKEEKTGDLVSGEEQSRFAYLRKLNAMKLEQKRAIREENFERAAQLRDEIRELEKAHKEQKEQKKDA